MSRTFNIPKKGKRTTCDCGTEFMKIGIKPWHPYCSPQCKLKYVSGKVDLDNLEGKPHSILMQVAKGVFDEFIRERDKNQVDITDLKPFKKSDKITASHIYPCNQYPGLMFEEDNCFASKEVNNFRMGEDEIWQQTFKNVESRIGEKAAIYLTSLSCTTYAKQCKWSTPELIEIINEYKTKTEEIKNTPAL